jgi:hypothetical protein
MEEATIEEIHKWCEGNELWATALIDQSDQILTVPMSCYSMKTFFRSHILYLSLPQLAWEKGFDVVGIASSTSSQSF